MPLVASESDSKPRQLPPAGTHIARCFQVIDLGTQRGEWAGKPKLSRKVRVSWELPDEKAVFSSDKGEEPFVISKTYTLSLGEKANLRHDLESWRGKPFNAEELKGFDIFNLLDVPCLLSVLHETKGDKTYANVSTVSKLAKGMTCPDGINPIVKFEVSEGRNKTFNAFPEWLQKLVSACVEWSEPEPHKEQEREHEEEPGTDDGLPF